jgi:hypothetical protein
MGSVVSSGELAERRRERQRAKIIATLERQANAQAKAHLRPQKVRSVHFYELILTIIAIAISVGVLIAAKMVADSAVDQTSSIAEAPRIERR